MYLVIGVALYFSDSLEVGSSTSEIEVDGVGVITSEALPVVVFFLKQSSVLCFPLQIIQRLFFLHLSFSSGFSLPSGPRNFAYGLGIVCVLEDEDADLLELQF